jgi:hypothetical protein
MRISVPKRSGITRTDVLIAVSAAALLGYVSLPRLTICRADARRISCVNNLKQTGVALRTWASEHDNRFPWTVPQNEGGTLEFQRTLGVFRLFQIASQELTTPKVLWCPADASRVRATNFGAKLSNQNISYFVGLDTDLMLPQTILSGDRTLTVNSNMMSGLVEIADPKTASWAQGLHERGGNLGLSDGSVQQTPDQSLRNHLRGAKQTTGAASSRFSIP